MNNQRLKIAIVSPYFHKTTGAGRYSVELTKALAEKHEVYIVTHSWDKELEDIISIIKVPMLRRPGFLSYFIFSVFSFIKLFPHRFDIIHGEITSTLRHDIITAHACFKYQFKLLLDEIKNPFLRFWHIIRPGNRYILLMEMIHYRLRDYKKIIAVSPRVKRQLMEEYNIPDKNVVVIPNGINHDEFAPDNNFSKIRKKVRKGYNIDVDEIVILFIGHNFKRKGLDYLLRALVPLPNKIKLIVVGYGNKTMYKDLARKLKIFDRIHFVGATNNVKDYYTASDIFVLPSMDEPFGLVVLEAMASGLPSIISKSVGIAEMLEHKKECLIVEEPPDAKEISKMINFLLDDEFRNYIAQNGRLKSQEFSWRRVAEEVEKEVYTVITDEKTT